MKKLKDMLEKEDGADSAGMEKDAKLSALRELRGIASKAMGDGMKGKMDGMKKVTVASDDKAGLVEGLKKAKDMMSGDEEESPEEESSESSADESAEDMDESPEEEMTEMEKEEMSPEEIHAMIKMLQSKLSKVSK